MSEMTPADERMLLKILEHEATLDMLDRIMATLAFSAGSPSEQAIYAEARQLLAEHGRGGVPKEMRDAYEKWEASRG